ncbi:MAG TPA: LytTR family DNA-binding domain-containing protein, partial [Arenibacter sp.]|nr:LytTR family DNA-binding domain-containing protein [Arenibacter sp.]
LIFLDIHLPKISGIDFLKTLKQKPPVILTTAFSNYALESYEYDVVDYLLKPFSFERFVQAVSKVPIPKAEQPEQEGQEVNASTADVIFIKSGYEHIRIDITDILYVRSDADYTEIYTEGKKHLSQEPLRYWEEHLNRKKFVRIHRSFIINTSKIEKIIGNRVYLIQKTTIPVGRAYKESFMQHILK